MQNKTNLKTTFITIIKIKRYNWNILLKVALNTITPYIEKALQNGHLLILWDEHKYMSGVWRIPRSLQVKENLQHLNEN
jgi:hypothetical protein